VTLCEGASITVCFGTGGRHRRSPGWLHAVLYCTVSALFEVDAISKLLRGQGFRLVQPASQVSVEQRQRRRKGSTPTGEQKGQLRERPKKNPNREDRKILPSPPSLALPRTHKCPPRRGAAIELQGSTLILQCRKSTALSRLEMLHLYSK
jgi:hypothetical protein